MDGYHFLENFKLYGRRHRGRGGQTKTEAKRAEAKVKSEALCGLQNISTVRTKYISTLHTGMRLKEILDLKWKNIYIRNVLSPYLEVVMSKNNEKRMIPSFASHFVMSGGDLLSLKEILGHSDIRMVQRYSHLRSEYKKEKLNNLDRVFQQVPTNLPQRGKIGGIGNVVND